jgi:hypothetical protein
MTENVKDTRPRTRLTTLQNPKKSCAGYVLNGAVRRGLQRVKNTREGETETGTEVS